MYSIVIVGIGEWEKYTRPLIDSIYRYNPNAPIVVVDNESADPYPRYKNAEIIRTERTCYAQAINTGLFAAPLSPWYLVMNNDVLCTGGVGEFLSGLSPYSVYGPFEHREHNWRWIDGWIYALSFTLWNEVGEFDKNFQYAAFEDADYCIRAQKKGFDVRVADFPFKHLERRIRTTMPQFNERRLANYRYLIGKHAI